MTITIFGAGAVGLYLAAKLALSGQTVGIVARGANLAALRRRGGRYRQGGEVRDFAVRATDRPAELGPQDLVIIAVKAQSLGPAAAAIATLVGPDTVLLAAQNGLPWWYTYRVGGALEGRRIAALDPDGAIAAKLDPARAIGCVLVMAASVPEPGLVQHLSGDELILGEPDGSASNRLARMTARLRDAGINVATTDRIRDAVWLKLWGNMTFNPVSVLTRGNLLDLANDPDTLFVLRRAMREAQAVGEAVGVRFGRDLEARIEESRIVGPHKSSTLQDFEAGRDLEIEALLGAPIELARAVGIATPTLDMIAALTRLAARSRTRPSGS